MGGWPQFLLSCPHTHVASSMSVLSFYLRWSESQKPGRRKKKIHLSPSLLSPGFEVISGFSTPPSYSASSPFHLQIFLFPPFFFWVTLYCNLTHITQQKLLPAFPHFLIYFFKREIFENNSPDDRTRYIYIIFPAVCILIIINVGHDSGLVWTLELVITAIC